MGKKGLIERACVACPKLRDFFDPAVGSWVDAPGVDDHLNALRRANIQARIQGVSEEDIPDHINESANQKLCRRQCAWDSSRKRMVSGTVACPASRSLTDPGEASKELAWH